MRGGVDTVKERWIGYVVEKRTWSRQQEATNIYGAAWRCQADIRSGPIPITGYNLFGDKEITKDGGLKGDQLCNSLSRQIQ